MQKIQGGAVYASTSFITDFLKDGSFPKIHENMGRVMSLIPEKDRKGAIDFGACHGMLSLRAKSMGFSPVLGLEGDKPSVDLFNQFIKASGVVLVNDRIDVRVPSFAQEMSLRCQTYNITTALARRVLPEILSSTYGKAGEKEEVWRDAGAKFSAALQGAGIRYLVVEGREFRSNTSHPLGHIDRELDALGDTWQVVHRIKDAVLLTPAGATYAA